jgi:hypothetical protein
MLLESFILLTLTSPTGTCAAALDAAPHYTACARGSTGMTLSTTQDGADRLLLQAEAAEPRFRDHFPGTTPPYLVLYFEDEPPLAALRDAGFTTVLAWPSPARVSELMTAALRQNALAREGGVELSEEGSHAASADGCGAGLAGDEAGRRGVP